METESEMEEEDMDVDALAARHDRLRGWSSGVGVRFKYEPDALREVILHPRPLLPTAASVSPHARKRQRIDDDDHDDPMHTMTDGANTSAPVRRGVELETAVEHFPSRMYVANSDDGTDAGNEDAGGADKTKMPVEDQQQQSGGEATHAQSDCPRWQNWLLGSLDDDNMDRPPPSPFSMLDREDGLSRRVRWRVRCCSAGCAHRVRGG
ncbi:hypothetical protein BJV78DRAFT_1251865 [Lactifluus subvellereus]|nr:hypothetical protein BJV78DRAFT_1251865 [Lactifluus subvellereus]